MARKLKITAPMPMFILGIANSARIVCPSRALPTINMQCSLPACSKLETMQPKREPISTHACMASQLIADTEVIAIAMKSQAKQYAQERFVHAFIIIFRNGTCSRVFLQPPKIRNFYIHR